jgi:hypothetical protein
MAADDKTTDDVIDDPTPEPAEMAPGGKDAEPDNDAAKLKAELDKVRKTLNETNRRAAADRKFREDKEREAEEKQAATLPEIEKERKARGAAEQRATAAEQRIQSLSSDLETAKLELVVEREARLQGWAHPELALRNIERDRITFDEDKGKHLGVKEALEAFAKMYPGIVNGSGDRKPFGGGTPPRSDASRRPDSSSNPNGGGNSARRQPNVDPYEQELQEIRPVGRM